MADNRKLSGQTRRAGLVRAGGAAFAIAMLVSAIAAGVGGGPASALSCTASSGAVAVAGSTCGLVKPNSVRWQ